MGSFSARKYESGSGHGQGLNLSVLAGCLRVMDSTGKELDIAFSDIELDIGGFSENRVILKDKRNNDTFISTDLSLLDALQKDSGSAVLSKQIANARGQLRARPLKEARFWLITACVIALIGGIAYATVEWLVGVAAEKIPPSMEESIGDLCWGSYEKDNKTKIDKGSTKLTRVQRIGEKLVSNLDDNPYTFKFHVENSPDVNAFAFPGGHITVLTGLLDKAESDDEIAGVLSHEIGHVIGRHSLRQAVHSVGLSVSLSMLLGDGGSDLAKIAGAALQLEDMNYGRSQESDADNVGVRLALKAGYDPEDLISFFDRLGKDYGALNTKALSLVSSHPMPVERIENIRKQIRLIKMKQGKLDNQSTP